MRKGDLGALLGAFGAVMSLLIAVWPGSRIKDGVETAVQNPEWVFVAHLLAGSLGVAAILLASRSIGLARLLMGGGAILLLALLFTQPFHWLNLVTTTGPGVAMGMGALLLADAEVAVR